MADLFDDDDVPRQIKGVVDPKLVSEVEDFSGKNEDWTTFKDSFMIAAANAQLDVLMEAALAPRVEDLVLASFGERQQMQSRALYVLLGYKLKKGRGKNLFQQTEKNNGFLVWRKLCDEYEVDESMRHSAMLAGLLNPKFEDEMVKRQIPFMDVLQEWELAIEKYKNQSKQPFPEGMMLSIVMTHAPADVKATLRTSQSAIQGKYENLKALCRGFENSGIVYDIRGNPVSGGPAKMDVGAVDGGKKGTGKDWWKGKGKDFKGKGKWWKGKKGKGKKGAKGKKGTEGKGKAGGGSAASSSSAYFNGTCGHCGKWGHKRADCWTLKKKKEAAAAADKEAGGVGAMEAESSNEDTPYPEDEDHWDWDEEWPSDEASGNCFGISCTGWEGSDGIAPEAAVSAGEQPAAEESSNHHPYNSESEEFGIIGALEKKGQTKKGETILVSWDSGSDEHVCPRWFGNTEELDTSSVPRLYAINGEKLKVLGRRRITMTAYDASGKEHRINNVFTVGDFVTKPVWSAGKAYKEGVKAVTDPNGSSYLQLKNGVRIPLKMEKNSWYAEVDQVATITDNTKKKPIKTLEPRSKVEEKEKKEEEWRQIYEGLLSKAQSVQEVLDAEAQSLKKLRIMTGCSGCNNSGCVAPVEDGGPEEEPDSGGAAPSSGGDGQGQENPENVGTTGNPEFQARAKPVITEKSSIQQMMDRLRELRAPIYGTKAEKYARILKAEAEVAKEEEIQQLMRERQERRRDLGEAYVPTLLPVPKAPTALERFTHELTHEPPEPWCEHCVMGKMQDRPHRKRTSEDRERAPPELQMDYMYLDASCRTCSKAEAWTTIVTIVDIDSGSPMALVLPTKSPELEYCVDSCHDFIRRMNHGKIVIKTDGEPSIKMLAEKIKDKRMPLPTQTQHTPRYSPQTLGAMGVSQKLVQGQIRTLKAELEAKYGFGLTPDHCMWPWLVRHAAWTMERYHVKQNGHTPFMDTTGAWYKGEIVPFGETVLYKVPFSQSRHRPGGKQHKADARFLRGLFLGKSNENDEYYVATPDNGVLTARTVRRLEEARQCDRVLMKTVYGVPWSHKMGRPVRKEPGATLPLPGKSASVATEQEEREAGIPVPEPAPAAASEGAASTAPAAQETSTADVRPRPMEAAEAAALKRQVLPEGERAAQRRRTEEPRDALYPMRMAMASSRTERPSAEEPGGKRMKTANNEVSGDMMVGGIDAPESMCCDEFTAEREGLESEETEWWNQEIIEEDIFDDEDWDPDDHYVTGDGELTEEQLEVKGMWEEIHLMEQFSVFEVMERADTSHCKQLSNRWVKAKKGNSIRMRFVAREIKHRESKRTDLYTPASTSNAERVIDLLAVKQKKSRMIIDAKNAYFHADEDEDVAVDPPEVWMKWWIDNGGSPTVTWRLKKQLYGRRKASQKFQEYVSKVLQTHGFERCEMMPQFHKHVERGIVLELHQDDFHAVGDAADLCWMRDQVKKNLMIKASQPIGPVFGNETLVYSHLRCERILTKDGEVLKMPKKHVEKLQQLMGMEGCAPCPTPITMDVFKEDTSEKLNEEMATKFRTANGILQYVGRYRPDCQYAIKEIGKNSHNPSQDGLKRLKRIIRYLSGTLDMGIFFPVEGSITESVSSSDSDWAKDQEHRKSTSCGMVHVGGCLLTSFSRTQTVQAQSSGEAEWYAIVSTFMEQLNLDRLLRWIGIETTMTLQSDSAAARGVAFRSGVGRIKHLEVKTLWFQEFAQGKRDERVNVVSVDTNSNCADVGTKPHTEEKLLKLLRLVGCVKTSSEGLKEVTQELLDKDFEGTLSVGSVTSAAARRLLCGLMAFAAATGAASTKAVDFYNDDESGVLALRNKRLRDMSWEDIFVVMMITFAVIGFVNTVVGMIKMCVTMKRCYDRCCKRRYKEEGADSPPARGTDKCTQSPATYKWWWAKPEFRALGTREHGCW